MEVEIIRGPRDIIAGAKHTYQQKVEMKNGKGPSVLY
jgi:hypothetical protein